MCPKQNYRKVGRKDLSDRRIEIIKNELLGEEMTRIAHPSGLMIYVVRKDFASAYAVFGTRYGSFDNAFTLDGERTVVPHGIAHFLEHKMFETEGGQDTFELFSEIGADANAYTSTDRTAYLFSCTEDFYTAFEVLVNMVATPVFTEENVKKEQGIIAQEIKMCEDRPSNTLHYNLMKALYEKSPVRIPIAGTVESIAEITPELLYKCCNAFYRMNNMAICVCGNVDVSEILKIVDKHIPENQQEKVVFEDVPDSKGVFMPIISEEKDIAKPLFSIGIKFPEATKENSYACDILCEALFGMCEDFYSEIFESDMVSSYHYYYEFSRASSYFAIGGETPEPDWVLERVRALVAKALENGIPMDAFERAKRKVYADTVRGFDSSENIAEEMFESFLAYDGFLDSAEKYSAVTYDEVLALSKTVLSLDRIAMSALYPQKEKGQI